MQAHGRRLLHRRNTRSLYRQAERQRRTRAFPSRRRQADPPGWRAGTAPPRRQRDGPAILSLSARRPTRQTPAGRPSPSSLALTASRTGCGSRLRQHITESTQISKKSEETTATKRATNQTKATGFFIMVRPCMWLSPSCCVKDLRCGPTREGVQQSLRTRAAAVKADC